MGASIFPFRGGRCQASGLQKYPFEDAVNDKYQCGCTCRKEDCYSVWPKPMGVVSAYRPASQSLGNLKFAPFRQFGVWLVCPQRGGQTGFSTKPLREYAPAALSSASTVAAIGSALDFSTQQGVRAVAIPKEVSVEFCRESPPVTQPPHVKPSMAIAAATAPFKAGAVHVGISKV